MLVAWNVAEFKHFKSLLTGPRADVLVLLTTFSLTVLFDLSIAVGTGIVLSAILFMRRMAQVSTVAGITDDLEQGQETERPDPKDPGRVAEKRIPPGVEVYEINGPFFFGVANNLRDALDQVEKPPKILILRMRYVPHIDATGLNALREFHRRCKKTGTLLLLGGVHMHPMFEMVKAGMDTEIGLDNIFDNLDDALIKARHVLGIKNGDGTPLPPISSAKGPEPAIASRP
jgi:SulP family sulfate permease